MLNDAEFHNSQIKISIVTPVFNGAKYLEKTITSVINQKYSNLEYIIIDGGSTDGSVEIIKKYSSQLKYWVSEKDNGLYDAIQKGFAIATGDILAWINADDFYSEYAFETVSEIFTKFPQVDWLTGLNVTYDEQNRIVNAYKARNFTRFDLLNNDFMWIQQESTFWRRKLWEKAGGSFGSYKLAADFELWLRFSRFSDLYRTDFYLGGFRQQSKDQLSITRYNEYIAECFDAIYNEPKSKEELHKITAFKILTKLDKYIKKIKILNPNIIRFFQKRMLPHKNTKIEFNREKQEFYL